MKRAWIFALFVALLALGFTSCSGKSDPCDGVVCEFGVCDQGQCGNAPSCSDDAACLEGWGCLDGACVAQLPCGPDAPCERGTCHEGACINPSSCDVDEACLSGFDCNAGVCVESRCAVQCVRGVCNPSSQTCVNSDVCTIATQAEACLDGYYCYGQACELGQVICDELDCQRGVCDASVLGCVEPATCSDDLDCLEGSYCADGACAPNECDVQMRECARGVCEPSTARCENADVCASHTDCVDGFSCVDAACVRAGQECGSACVGTQRCVYDPDSLTAMCEEGAVCFSTGDCLGARVCLEDGTCGSAPPCEADALEPNEHIEDATRIADHGKFVEASICANDVDVFVFHTDEGAIFRGVLLVDLALAPRDVGGGELDLKVTTPAGDVREATTDADGVARLAVEVGVLDFGEYQIEVSGGVGAGGLRYTLFADLLDEPAVAACENPIPLTSAGATGSTRSGASYLLATACGPQPNLAAEDVYQFTLTQPSWVRVEAVTAEADVILSLQHRCEAPSVVACVNDVTLNGRERIEVQLGVGTYFVLVEGAGTLGGGPYTLEFDARPVVCSRENAACLDEDTSRFCSAAGTGFEEEPCLNGCDAATGRCDRAQRDACFNAVDASQGYNDVIDWTLLQNDYDPGVGGCVPVSGGSTQTSGPDAAYAVTLPPNHVLVASQLLGSGDRGALYLVEDCDRMSSCVAAANGSTGTSEELIYFNTTDATQQLFLIADTEADTSFNLGTVNISVTPLVCTPGEVRCDGADRAETCRPLGGGWDSQWCTAGCDDGVGVCAPVANNSCDAGAIDLVANGPFTGRIEEYTRDYNPGTSCAGRATTGSEALFRVTPAAGEVARVTVNAAFDAQLWVVTDCSDLTGSCVAASDNTTPTRVVEFAGDGVTTFYVAVDSLFNGTGTFTVSAQLLQPQCTPNALMGCATSTSLRYCSALGLETLYTCATTCSLGRCDQPSGQICADAIVLGDGDSRSGTMNFPNTIDPGLGVSGLCDFPAGSQPNGSDIIFAVDLQAGDWLFADYTMNSSFALAYVLEDCHSTDSCVAQSARGMAGTVVYEATEPKRVFVVLDRTTTSISSINYTFEVDIRRQDCAPGSASYCVDGATIGYCDAQGFSRTFDCDSGCFGGRCNVAAGDACIDAIPVVAGQTVTGDWSDGSNQVQPNGVLVGACSFDDVDTLHGPEDIYVIDLLPGELLTARLATNYGSALHYILTDCLDTASCVDANFDRGPGIVQHYSALGGPVFVVVDTISSGFSSTTYDLTFNVTPGGQCAPNGAVCESGFLTRCNADGQPMPPVMCANGCATPTACAADPGSDVCVDAPLTSGTRVYARFDELTNDVAIGSGGCTNYAGAGSDLIYAVAAGPGEVIRASVKSLGREQVQIYITPSCSDPTTSCVAGALGGFSQDYGAEVLYSPTAFGTYYVVAEGTSSLNDEPFIVEIDIVAPQCTPGTNQCAASGQAMLVCNDVGLWDEYACDGGCVAGECGSPRGFACFDAIPMVDGTSHTGTFGHGASAINPGGGVAGACTFAGNGAPGADTIFSVELQANEVLTVDYTSATSSALVYMLGDCGDADSCLAATSTGTSGALTYVAPSDETVFFVVDRSLSGSTTLSYTVNVTVETPDCSPGAAPTCTDATTLSYCDVRGFTQTYDCNGTCSAGACDTPSAEVCVDAGTLTHGATVTGTFEGTDSSSPQAGTHGACEFAAAAHGVDHFYNVSLQAGEWLLVDYETATSNAVAYLLGTCGDTDTCRAVTAAGSQGRLAYQAPVAEDVTFVIDRTTSTSTPIDWTFDVTIGTPTCTTGQTQCGDATTLQWCNEYGLYESFPCATTCSAGACDSPSSDICADAIVLTDGMTVMDDFGGTNSADLGGATAGQCAFAGESQPGVDHFYRIDLLAGQTLTVDWTSNSAFAIAYLTRDCLDATACVDHNASSTSGTLSYSATVDEAVFLVVDRTISGVSTSLTYEATVQID